MQWAFPAGVQEPVDWLTRRGALVMRRWLIVDGQWFGCGWDVDGQPEAAPSSHTLRAFCRHPEE